MKFTADLEMHTFAWRPDTPSRKDREGRTVAETPFALISGDIYSRFLDHIDLKAFRVLQNIISGGKMALLLPSLNRLEFVPRLYVQTSIYANSNKLLF